MLAPSPPSILSDRGRDMRRRQIIASIGGALALPPPLRAQPAGRTWRIAILSFTNRRVAPVVALVDELRALGFVEGRTLVIDDRGFDQTPTGLDWTAKAI